MEVSEQRYFLDPGALGAGSAIVRTTNGTLGPGWLYFKEPREVVSTYEADQVEKLLDLVSLETAQGAIAVGFVSFEGGCALDESFASDQSGQMPLAWFALYDEPPIFARELAPIYSQKAARTLRLDISRGEFHVGFERIHTAIGNGETYQVNFTTRLSFEPGESTFDLFRRVCGVEPPPYACYLEGADWTVASFSPELFLERVGHTVSTKPMKGTLGIDEKNVLSADPKSLAENLMIVDMTRNDLGRIAEIGSVRASQLFQVEPHRTVLQMTSTVMADTTCSTTELLRAMLPPASVTGAPKVAACQIIRDLESSPREVYCGAIGTFGPFEDLRLSVGIRTVWQMRSGESTAGPARYGIGSGIVWDSTEAQEWDEWQLKSKILTEDAKQWELVECFHRDALSHPRLLEFHLDRLLSSAAALGIPLTELSVQESLEPMRGADREIPVKIRLAVRRTGQVSVTASDSSLPNRPLRAALADIPIIHSDLNFRYKTNSRQIFDHQLALHPQCDEVLLYNEMGEIAEFCRGNVVCRIDGQLLSPHPECGCLPGVGVKRLVEAGEVAYGRISVEEAVSSSEMFFVNSIMGKVGVELVG